jgi:uncharacterized protein YndB with AHSA1/START domain
LLHYFEAEEELKMAEPVVVHSTFVIQRSYPQPPARVFAAFAQPARKRRWYAEGDHEIQEFEMEFRVGGSERFSYRFKEGHPIAGSGIANESTFQDIVPETRIVTTTRMSLNGKPILVAVLTLEFVSSATGTDLVFTNQGTYIDWAGGPSMIEQGWRSLFDRLEKHLAS